MDFDSQDEHVRRLRREDRYHFCPFYTFRNSLSLLQLVASTAHSKDTGLVVLSMALIVSTKHQLAQGAKHADVRQCCELEIVSLTVTTAVALGLLPFLHAYQAVALVAS